MIKRTLEISQESVHLAVQLDQLRLMRHGPEAGILASVPCEGIGLVVVDNPATTYSHAALARLIEFGAGVVVCGRNHLPAGLLLPLTAHSEVVPRIHQQIAAPKPLCKQLWSQIVAAKILGQAGNLRSQSPARRRLLTLAREVKSGDRTNVEAQAAKVYWSAWLEQEQGLRDGKDAGKVQFRRMPEASDPLNAMLNYGYAVLRAAVGRAVVSAGLLPALGLKHSNRSNAFCLADDLLEPLRPMVDRTVRGLYWEGVREVGKPAKTRLLGLLTSTVRVDGQTGPLMVALHRTVGSLLNCYEGQEKRLLLPESVEG